MHRRLILDVPANIGPHILQTGSCSFVALSREISGVEEDNIYVANSRCVKAGAKFGVPNEITNNACADPSIW